MCRMKLDIYRVCSKFKYLYKQQISQSMNVLIISWCHVSVKTIIVYFLGGEEGVGAGVWLGRVLKTILYRAHIFLTVISDVLFTKERERIYNTDKSDWYHVMNLICFINRAWFCYLMRKCVNVIKNTDKEMNKKMKSTYMYMCTCVCTYIYDSN